MIAERTIAGLPSDGDGFVRLKRLWLSFSLRCAPPASCASEPEVKGRADPAAQRMTPSIARGGGCPDPAGTPLRHYDPQPSTGVGHMPSMSQGRATGSSSRENWSPPPPASCCAHWRVAPAAQSATWSCGWSLLSANSMAPIRGFMNSPGRAGSGKRGTVCRRVVLRSTTFDASCTRRKLPRV